MGYRTAREAASEFVEALQLAVSCVTSGVINNRGGNFPAPDPHVAVLVKPEEGGPIPLQMREARIPRLGLKFSHSYRILEDAESGGPWRVRTASYQYNLYSVDDQDEFQELLLYHWHPSPQPPIGQGGSGRPVTTPHVHVKAIHVGPDGSPLFPGHLSNLHMPTGRVALQDIVRFAISDLDVKWLRDDWEDVLDKTRRVFLESRTWD